MTTISQDEFFSEPFEQSKIKSSIVSEYFKPWVEIISKRTNRMGYIDLFSGPGTYGDGSPSTPLLILDTIKQKGLVNNFRIIFNDKDSSNIAKLKEKINSDFPEFNSSTTFYSHDIEEVWGELKKQTDQGKQLLPSFVFLDPFGYKGITIDMLTKITSGWGCDTVLFFNHNRVNMALSNPMVRNAMIKMWGSDDIIEQVKEETNPYKREVMIVDALSSAIRRGGIRYVLPFKFKSSSQNRTSHYLIFMTKNLRGYNIMKEIMWKKSMDEEGFGTFDYETNADAFAKQFSLLALYGLGEEGTLSKRIINYLKENGKTQVGYLIENDSVDTKYVVKNYKQTIISMIDRGEIICSDPRPNAKARRKDTLSDLLELELAGQGS